MLFKVLIALMATGQILAAPPPHKKRQGTLTCSSDGRQYSESGGVMRDVPPGTKCQNGQFVNTLEAASTTISAGPTSFNAGVSTSSTSATSSAAVVTGASGWVNPAGAQLPLTVQTGTATCPSVSPATVTASVAAPASTSAWPGGKRFVTYWSAWHGTGQGILPTSKQLKGVTHLILSFWDPNTMSSFSPSSNTLWTPETAKQLRELRGADKDLKVMAAFGGWALDEFFRFNATDANRDKLADVFAEFILHYDLDGADIDWEYPVNNGAHYQTTRPIGPCDKDNNVLLMQSFRNKLEGLKTKPNGKGEYVLSLAVPGIEEDMLAYDAPAVKEISKVVDFWNIMSYDIMNRRSKTTEHHSGYSAQSKSAALYKARGVDPKKMNIGFAMYAKWFKVAGCNAASTIGCTVPANAFESQDGSDAGTSGAIMFNAELMSAKDLGTINYASYQTIKPFWDQALAGGVDDTTALATSAYINGYFFTWMTGANTKAACDKLKTEYGGIMVWSIDQDNKGVDGGDRFDALQQCLGA